jgi:hypothetical protein
MHSSSMRYRLTLHTPMPPEVDPGAPQPTIDPNPASEPDENPLPDPTRTPEGDPPAKPPPVSMV